MHIQEGISRKKNFQFLHIVNLSIRCDYACKKMLPLHINKLQNGPLQNTQSNEMVMISLMYQAMSNSSQGT